MMDILQFDFMQNAVFAGILVSFICGMMGTLAVANRMVFLSGGIAHAAYGGIGLAFFMSWPYLLGTLGFTLIAATVMAAASLNFKHRADAIIGAVWAMGMATGIILIDLSPGYPVDLMGFLFGSILAVPRADVWVMLITGSAIATVICFYYTDFLAMSYDEAFARVRRVPVKKLYFLLVIMLAVAVVMTIRVVGLILVIALLTIAPFIAERFSQSLLGMMAWSCLLNVFFTLSGLTLSFFFNLTAGASIILVAGVCFFIFQAAMALPKLHPARRAKRQNTPQEN